MTNSNSDFIIECQICNSKENSLEHREKFNNYYDDSYTEHFVYLVCDECGNKKLIYSYNVSY